MTLAVYFAAVLLVAAPVEEKPSSVFPPRGDCRDDRLVDRCAPEQQGRVRELFGVKPIEEHRKAGDQVRRAFYVDGYGRDVVAIEFIRPKGADPLLRVHFPAREGQARTPPMSAAVDAERWSALLRRSEHFDREPQARPRKPGEKDEDEEIVLCLHSWVYTVEATDPARGEDEAPPVRRRTEDACDNGLAEAFATELGATAVPLLPPCALLDRERHRNDMSLLASCGLLKGDRLAAAGVMNRVDALRHSDEEEDLALLRPLFGYRAGVDWAGEANEGADAAAFWLRKTREADADFYFDEIVGETADRVRVLGALYRSVGEGEAERQELAKVELVWEQEGNRYQIERARVGPFEPVPKR